MKFSEKIQKLRKQHNLTQEELAEKLFISRTAISKWESNKGYPSIDVLKQISKIFDVSVDNLISSEQILELAKHDNQEKIKKNNMILVSILDLLTILLIILPLYGLKVDNYIYSVSLFQKNDLNSYIKITYLISYLTLFICGIFEMITSLCNKEKILKYVNVFSIIIHLILILFLIMTKEVYVCSLVFLLFILKVILLFINLKNSRM